MPRRSLVFALLAACPQIAPSDADDTASLLPDEAVPAVLLNSPEWRLLPSFGPDANYKPGVLYGRATAQLTIGGGRCTGFLVDDDILVTADHCGRGAGLTLIADFGKFGPSDGNYSEGTNEASRRIRQLGVPATVAMATSTLTQFSCTWNSQDGSRDVSYWSCAGNDISWSTTAGPITYRVKPGHVWGHYNVSLGERPDDRQVYINSVNRACGQTQLNLLLAPGVVEDSVDDCVTGHTSCFDYTADMIGGSSGGPVIDRTTHTVFGTVNGHTWWWAGDPNDPCDRWDAATNTGSYIGPGVTPFLNRSAGGWTLGSWLGTSPWVGGTGGTRRYLYCPGDTLAAGVVGSTGDGGYVGNFGLICAPHTAPQAMRLDRSSVIAAGSVDTNFRLANPMDWNTYMHEVLSTRIGGLGVQTMAMCPAGSFITGITTRAGSYVDQISSLACRDPQTGATSTVTLGGAVGSIGTSWGGVPRTTSCASNTWFGGMWVNAGWLTDGFQGYCRYED